MVWITPTLPGLEADHVCLDEVFLEFCPILVFGGERLIFQNRGGIYSRALYCGERLVYH